MRYRFILTKWFDRGVHHLRRNNPQLTQDLENFLEHFDAEAHPVIVGTGGARKARMKRSGRGKSGSYRVIYYLYVANTVWLITIYDKVRQEELTAAEKSRIRYFVTAIKEKSGDQDLE